MCCLRENILTLRLSVGGRTDGRTDGRTHARTDGRKIFTQYSGISSCSLGSTDWGWDMQKWAFVYLGHTKVEICVCEVLGLG